MTDSDVLDRLKAVDPMDKADIRFSDEAFSEILGSIEEAPFDQVPAFAAGRPKRAWSLPRLGIAAGLVCAISAFVLVSGVLDRSGSGPGYSSAWGAELVKLAESSPLIIMDESKWRVSYVEESSPTFGRMNFKPLRGQDDLPRGVSLRWSDVDPDQLFTADQVVETDVPVLDTTATVIGAPWSGRNQAVEVIWADNDDRSIEVDTTATSRVDLEATLQSLDKVDIDSWLSALPAGVIRAGQGHEEAVKRALTGVPLPPGFEPEDVRGGSLNNGSFVVEADAVTAATCAWFAYWIEARANDSTENEERAVKAMASSTRWPVLRGWVKRGYGVQATTYWEYAAQMTGKHRTPTELAKLVEQSLGCEQQGVTVVPK